MFAINTLLLIAVLAVAGRHIFASPAHDRKALRPHEPRPEHFDPSLPEPHHVFELHPIDPALRRRQRRRQLRAAEMAPLFPGYGTHYVYAYVGTPPQRQSLIVDTGSHFTAFPCTGCKQCGEHTDPYWDVKKSTSAALPRCATKDQTCQVTQSYTEGSSWHGFKVQDTLWLGGEKAHLLPNAPDYAVNFTFACQTEETGLFRTQLADGIMGMSAAPDTRTSSALRRLPVCLPPVPCANAASRAQCPTSSRRRRSPTVACSRSATATAAASSRSAACARRSTRSARWRTRRWRCGRAGTA